MSLRNADLAARLQQLTGSSSGSNVIDSLRRSLETSRVNTEVLSRGSSQLEGEYQAQRQLLASQLRQQEQIAREQRAAQRAEQERQRVQQEFNDNAAAEAQRRYQSAFDKVTGGDTDRTRVLAEQGQLNTLIQRELEADFAVLQQSGEHLDEKTGALTFKALAFQQAGQFAAQGVAQDQQRLGVDAATLNQQVTAQQAADDANPVRNFAQSAAAAATRGVAGLAGLVPAAIGGASDLVGGDPAIGETFAGFGGSIARAGDALADRFDVVTTDELAANQRFGQAIQQFTDNPSLTTAGRAALDTGANLFTPGGLSTALEQTTGALAGGAGIGAAARVAGRAAGIANAAPAAGATIAARGTQAANPVGLPAIAVGQGGEFANTISDDPNANVGAEALGGVAAIAGGGLTGRLVGALGGETIEGAASQLLRRGVPGGTGSATGGRVANAARGVARGLPGEIAQESAEGLAGVTTAALASGDSLGDALTQGAGAVISAAPAAGLLGGSLGGLRGAVKNSEQVARRERADFRQRQGLSDSSGAVIPASQAAPNNVLQQLDDRGTEKLFLDFETNFTPEQQAATIQQIGEAAGADPARIADAVANASNLVSTAAPDGRFASPAEVRDELARRLDVNFTINDDGTVTSDREAVEQTATFNDALTPGDTGARGVTVDPTLTTEFTPADLTGADPIETVDSGVIENQNPARPETLPPLVTAPDTPQLADGINPNQLLDQQAAPTGANSEVARRLSTQDTSPQGELGADVDPNQLLNSDTESLTDEQIALQQATLSEAETATITLATDNPAPTTAIRRIASVGARGTGGIAGAELSTADIADGATLRQARAASTALNQVLARTYQGNAGRIGRFTKERLNQPLVPRSGDSITEAQRDAIADRSRAFLDLLTPEARIRFTRSAVGAEAEAITEGPTSGELSAGDSRATLEPGLPSQTPQDQVATPSAPSAPAGSSTPVVGAVAEAVNRPAPNEIPLGKRLDEVDYDEAWTEALRLIDNAEPQRARAFIQQAYELDDGSPDLARDRYRSQLESKVPEQSVAYFLRPDTFETNNSGDIAFDNQAFEDSIADISTPVETSLTQLDDGSYIDVDTGEQFSPQSRNDYRHLQEVGSQFDTGVQATPREIHSAIREVLSGGLQRVQVIPFTGPNDPTIPSDLQTSDPVDDITDGFVYNGAIYYNTNNIKTVTQARVLAAHEGIGHIALRDRFGPNFNAVLGDIFTRVGGTDGAIQMGARLGVDFNASYPELVREARAGRASSQRQLVEELVAQGAENEIIAEPTTAKIIGDAIRDIVSRIREWVANVPGLSEVFGQFNDRDLMRVVRETARDARRAPAFDPTTSDTDIRQSRRLATKAFDRLVGRKGEIVIRAGDQVVTVSPEATRVQSDATPDRVALVKDQNRQLAESFIGHTSELYQNYQQNPKSVPGPRATGIRQSIVNSDTYQNIIRGAANSQFAVGLAERRLSKLYSGNYQPVREAIQGYMATGNGLQIDNTIFDIPAAVQSVLQALPTATDQQLRNATSTDELLTVAYAKADSDYIRPVLEPLEGKVHTSIEALAGKLDTDPDTAYEQANSVLELLSMREENEAAFYLDSNLPPELDESRRELISAMNDPETSEEQAIQIWSDIKDIVASGHSDLSGALSSAASTGATIGNIDAALQALGIDYNASEFGLYADYLDTTKSIRKYVVDQRQRAGKENQQTRNWRSAYGFQFRLPNGKQALRGMAEDGAFTQQNVGAGALTEFPQNALDRLKALAHHTTFQSAFNEVERAVVLNTMIAESNQDNEAYQTASGGLYNGAKLRLIDRDSTEYSDRLISPKAHEFIWSVPNSNTAVMATFDPESDAAKQIRGERSRPQTEAGRQLQNAGRYGNSLMGRFLYRYSPAAPIRAFFREVATASTVLGSELGPGAVGDYIGHIWAGRGNANALMKYMRLRALGKFEEAAAMVDQQPDKLAGFHEFVAEGGLVTQLQGISATTGIDRFRQNRDSLGGRAEGLAEGSMGALHDLIDASVRYAAYQAVLEKNGGNKQEAAAYAKNLANFERRGKYGDVGASYFTFFNPAASGAARALQSVLEGEHGGTMVAYAAGAGLAMYPMLLAIAGEDEEGNNLLENEGTGRLTTDLRFMLSEDSSISLPLGFGGANGAFALGMQLSAALMGKQSFADAAVNTFDIASGNLSPVQTSRIPVIDQNGDWQLETKLLDSGIPSVLRPMTQMAYNMNGLGLSIYRDGFAGSDVGIDAFESTTGQVGTLAEGLAQALEQAGIADIQPGTIKHFLSNYVKAAYDLAEFTREAAGAIQGDNNIGKLLDGAPLLGGLVSKPGKSDEYYRIRRTIKAQEAREKDLERFAPERLEREREQRPENYEQLLEVIKDTDSELRRVRTRANDIIHSANVDRAKRREVVRESDRERLRIQTEFLRQYR